jgi:hypothetical protein
MGLLVERDCPPARAGSGSFRPPSCVQTGAEARRHRMQWGWTTAIAMLVAVLVQLVAKAVLRMNLPFSGAPFGLPTGLSIGLIAATLTWQRWQAYRD